MEQPPPLMDQVIHGSPKSPMEALSEEKISSPDPWLFLGTTMYLGLNDPSFDDHLDYFVNRVLGAWRARQCQILVNEQHQPWAYAAWFWVSPTRHEAVRQGDLVDADDWAPTDALPQPYLWLVDFITPFGHHQKALQHWQNLLQQTATQAWLSRSSSGATQPQIQQLWSTQG